MTYSADQNFQYIAKPCVQNKDRSFEGVAFKNDSYGSCKYIYCRKKTVQTGYQFKNTYVGTWITYDSVGKETARPDAGNTNQLLQLKDLYDPESK